MPPKPLTPQEFEDRYLSRTQETPGKEEKKKELQTSRRTVKKAISKSNDIFKFDEGFEARVQKYYDEAFDRAFEGITYEGGRNDDDYKAARLQSIKKLKEEGVVWGRMSGTEDRIVIDFGGVNPVGVLALYILDKSNPDSIPEQQQMNFYLKQAGSSPIISISPKPISWQMAAINLAGGISRLLFQKPKFGVALGEEEKRLVEDLTAAEVQIDLADHLTNGVFSSRIREETMKRIWLKTNKSFLSCALTSAAFEGFEPAEGESEALMRAWLWRMAVTCLIAHAKAGKDADQSAKFLAFVRAYKTLGESLDVKYAHIDT